jgi:hypothetical protein
VKQALLVGAMMVGCAGIASAQGTDIHTRCGESGSHFNLSADTQVFTYEATISPCTLAYVATLEVYHNGVLKAVKSQIVLLPQAYTFTTPIDMSSWGLKPGEQVTFRLKVVSLGLLGNLLASHTTIGDVIP